MALLDARCTFCGAPLKIDGALDTTNCQFCGAAFDVGSAVQNYFESMQAPQEVQPAAPRRLAPTKKTKATLICGLASCAAVPLAGVVWFAADAMSATVRKLYGVAAAIKLWDAVEMLTALLGAFGICLAIAGFVYSAIASK